ncbi:MAG: CBS domain-containing protein, partial [Bacteroidales bacterium]|nr:CBS domain-containing protein [Bacteroidales bacterium]
KEKDFITNLLTITDTQKVCDFIASTEMEIPPYILAKDIMKQVDVTLNENHTLADAVQYFINTGWLNIPVIDKDGDLVGEVTAQELMEVCLPRYVLWMDDLTPILNFEPFMNVLQNEEYTWLPEIMNMNIAKIQINDPAMKVAIEMVKKSVNHVYVLNDKKLAGIITLHTFLNKALRE